MDDMVPQGLGLDCASRASRHAAAATPQQQQQRSQPRVMLWDFWNWLLPDGRLDAEKRTTPEHVEVILQQWRMPPDALPMWHEQVNNLCYSVKKECQD